MKTVDLIVKSRYQAMEHKSERPWAVISITTPGCHRGEPQFSEENRKGLLRLSFYDANSEAQNWEGKIPGKLFSKDLAKQVLDFANCMWEEVDEILIHCDMGMSRSPGVAAALANIKYGRGADDVWFQTKIPNSLVYKTLLEVHNASQIF